MTLSTPGQGGAGIRLRVCGASDLLAKVRLSKGLVIKNGEGGGGYKTGGVGGAWEVGEAEKVLAMLKGGAQKVLG